jgi:hypothetical protein
MPVMLVSGEGSLSDLLPFYYLRLITSQSTSHQVPCLRSARGLVGLGAFGWDVSFPRDHFPAGLSNLWE